MVIAVAMPEDKKDVSKTEEKETKTDETCSYFKLYSKADRLDYILITAVSVS